MDDRKLDVAVDASSDQEDLILITVTKFRDYPEFHLKRSVGATKVVIFNHGIATAVAVAKPRRGWPEVHIAKLNFAGKWKLPMRISKHGEIIGGLRAPTKEESRLKHPPRTRGMRLRYGEIFGD